jgi:hypothetical protein
MCVWKIRSISWPASGKSSCVSRELVTGLRSCVLLARENTCENQTREFKHFPNLLQLDVAQRGVRDVPHEDPADLEDALPLVRRPDCTAASIVDRRQHLRHAAEMAARVDTEEEVDGSTAGGLLEGLVEALVSWISRAPDFVLDRLVHVVFRIRLDNEEPGLCDLVSFVASNISNVRYTQRGVWYQS